jgi:hypothetical protein
MKMKLTNCLSILLVVFFVMGVLFSTHAGQKGVVVSPSAGGAKVETDTSKAASEKVKPGKIEPKAVPEETKVAPKKKKVEIKQPPKPTLPEKCNGKIVTRLGTSGVDILIGTDGPDVIHGLGDNDIIRGMGGDDTICGGDGDDKLDGGSGNDTLDGGPGNDECINGPSGAGYLVAPKNCEKKGLPPAVGISPKTQRKPGDTSGGFVPDKTAQRTQLEQKKQLESNPFVRKKQPESNHKTPSSKMTSEKTQYARVHRIVFPDRKHPTQLCNRGVYRNDFLLCAILLPDSSSEEGKTDIIGKTVDFFINDKFVGAVQSNSDGKVALPIKVHNWSQMNFLKVGTNNLKVQTRFEGKIVNRNSTVSISKNRAHFVDIDVRPYIQKKIGDTITISGMAEYYANNMPSSLTSAVLEGLQTFFGKEMIPDDFMAPSGPYAIPNEQMDLKIYRLFPALQSWDYEYCSREVLGQIGIVSTRTNNQGGFEYELALTTDLFNGPKCVVNYEARIEPKIVSSRFDTGQASPYGNLSLSVSP